MYKTGPMTPAQRMREKRARDRNLVAVSEDLEALSDSGLVERLAESIRADFTRKKQGTKRRGAITRWLWKEVEKRL
jgi:hypothetical protein